MKNIELQAILSQFSDHSEVVLLSPWNPNGTGESITDATEEEAHKSDEVFDSLPGDLIIRIRA